jgi:hypothetical protein
MLLCTLAVLVVAGVAVADLRRTEERLPPIPQPCPHASVSCHEARNAQLAQRLDERLRLEDEYEVRAWIYALGVVVAVAAAIAAKMRGRPRERWSDVLTALGVAGVWLAIVVTGLLLLSSSMTVEAAWTPAYFPSLVMCASAGLGLGVLRLRGWETEDKPGASTPSEMRLAGLRRGLQTAAPKLALGALALTGATVVLALAFALPQPDCSAGEPGDTVPTWADAVGVAALASAVAAGALALSALLALRWIAALVSLVANPSALLFMVASTCAFY